MCRIPPLRKMAHQGGPGRAVRDRAEVARRLGLTRARVTQLLDLAPLASDTREQVLFAESVDGLEPMCERAVRAEVRVEDRAKQRQGVSLTGERHPEASNGHQPLHKGADGFQGRASSQGDQGPPSEGGQGRRGLDTHDAPPCADSLSRQAALGPWQGVFSERSPFAWAPSRGILRGTMRTIRRYSNRKLYDIKESHYVTLARVAAIIREGDDIQVLEKETGRDITAATMALIIFEEEKQRPTLPVAGLRKIIQTGQVS